MVIKNATPLTPFPLGYEQGYNFKPKQQAINAPRGRGKKLYTIAVRGDVPNKH